MSLDLDNLINDIQIAASQALEKDVTAESSDPRDPISEVDRLMGLEALALGGSEDLVDHPHDVVRRKRCRLDRDEPALDPQQRGAHRFQMQI